MKVTKKESKRFKSWTPAEKQIMSKCYAKEGMRVADRLPQKTMNQIYHYASAHGLKANANANPRGGAASPASEKYSASEVIKIVKMRSDGFTPKEIAEETGRTRVAINALFGRLGLTKKKQNYTEAEKLIMQYFYATEGKDVSKRINRTPQALATYAHNHGLVSKRLSDRQMTQEEINLIEGCYETKSATFIADVLNRSSATVSQKIKEIKKEKAMVENYNTEWTGEEVSILMVNYNDPTKCEELLNRTKSAIESKARRLNLK